VYQGSFKRVMAVPVKQPEMTVLLRVAADVPLILGQSIGLDFPASKIMVLKD
jgi:hypothetical protein